MKDESDAKEGATDKGQTWNYHSLRIVYLELTIKRLIFWRRSGKTLVAKSRR
jgi:hypothetical protein